MNKEKKTLNVTGHSKLFYSVSCGLIVLFIVLTAVIGLNVDIEFKGGTILTYSYTGDINTSDVQNVVSDTLSMKSTVTKGENTATSQTTVKIEFASTGGISDEKQNTLKEALVESFPDNEIELFETNDVNASNGMDFFLKCMVACAFAAVITIVYIGFRFRKIGGISAGVFSVVALVHDMCMVYGCFVICRFDINANFMAVLLTILGYSINATIIIYDRIRENQRLLGNKIGLDELVNLSITQTLGRSIHTTVTTIAAMATVCVVCLIFNVSSIISFAFPLIIGMISGVYSSNCIAPTLWVLWRRHREKNPKASKKSKNKDVKRSGRR
ncbi:MAG: protein translocase subunit SecF [Ruminococcus sp.]|nr:protein translocase subunit SecF [Ruminococcus sp.]